MMALLWKYREALFGLVKSIIAAGEDPNVELRRMTSSREARTRAEEAGRIAERKRFGR